MSPSLTPHLSQDMSHLWLFSLTFQTQPATKCTLALSSLGWGHVSHTGISGSIPGIYLTEDSVHHPPPPTQCDNPRFCLIENHHPDRLLGHVWKQHNLINGSCTDTSQMGAMRKEDSDSISCTVHGGDDPTQACQSDSSQETITP